MNNKQFISTVNEQIETCVRILEGKAKEYATEDRLHNFKVAAELLGCTPEQALAGMMAKHTVSIYDMCRGDGDLRMDVWEEKITDSINYLLLLKAILVEEDQIYNERVTIQYGDGRSENITVQKNHD